MNSLQEEAWALLSRCPGKSRWGERGVKRVPGEFPAGPVVERLQASNTGAGGSVPGWGTIILHAVWLKNKRNK